MRQPDRLLASPDRTQTLTIGALPVARSEGVFAGYHSGLAMRRIAGLHASEAKTDARDAATIIAGAARTLPHALRSLKLADEHIAGLSMLQASMMILLHILLYQSF